MGQPDIDRIAQTNEDAELSTPGYGGDSLEEQNIAQARAAAKNVAGAALKELEEK